MAKFDVDLGDKVVSLDPKGFWLAAHCAPGTDDPTEICGFCGVSHLECATECTEAIRESHHEVCGGSGFWCPVCGLFWAQDTCGESDPYAAELRCADPNFKLTVNAGHVFCACGALLLKPIEVEE